MAINEKPTKVIFKGNILRFFFFEEYFSNTFFKKETPYKILLFSNNSRGISIS